jgi:hypothetical protein
LFIDFFVSNFLYLFELIAELSDPNHQYNSFVDTVNYQVAIAGHSLGGMSTYANSGNENEIISKNIGAAMTFEG